MAKDDGFLEGMSASYGVLPIRVTPPALVDRGYDRGEYRFCVVLPVGTVTRGESVETDRGVFDVTRIGRPYTKDGADVTNAYLDVTPAAVGAPEDRLTDEQIEYRRQAKANQAEGLARYLASTTPEERKRKAKDAWEKYAASTTYAERRARTRAGVKEFWRIYNADPDTLTPEERKRQDKAHARRKRTPEQRKRIADGTRKGIAARKARPPAVVTPEQQAAAVVELARILQEKKT